MKPRVLFIPASIKSHIIPSFYIANLLKGKYEVHYAVTNDKLKELVEANHFKAESIGIYKVLLGMEKRFIIEKLKIKPSFLNLVTTYKKQVVVNYRKEELSALCNTLKPMSIFLDIFCSTDYVLLKGLGVCRNIFFVNPMLSTYRVKHYPVVSESQFSDIKPMKSKFGFNKPKIPFKNWLFNFKNSYLDQTEHNAVLRTLSDNGMGLQDFAESNEFTIGFKNVPEFVLAPLELEFSNKIRHPWQYYLGLCTSENREDIEQDKNFSIAWLEILKNQGEKKIIYCSFGSYYNGPDNILLGFCDKLFDVIQSNKDLILVASVNTYVVQALANKLSQLSNAYFFSGVPQLEVLKKATLFITHGGLGSIKEAIHYQVPMLVYPLDPKYDQNGNAFKVEYYKLGLRGNFKFERKEDLEIKIEKLLKDNIYKTNLAEFKNTVTQKYVFENTQNTLAELMI